MARLGDYQDVKSENEKNIKELLIDYFEDRMHECIDEIPSILPYFTYIAFYLDKYEKIYIHTQIIKNIDASLNLTEPS